MACLLGTILVGISTDCLGQVITHRVILPQLTPNCSTLSDTTWRVAGSSSIFLNNLGRGAFGYVHPIDNPTSRTGRVGWMSFETNGYSDFDLNALNYPDLQPNSTCTFGITPCPGEYNVLQFLGLDPDSPSPEHDAVWSLERVWGNNFLCDGGDIERDQEHHVFLGGTALADCYGGSSTGYWTSPFFRQSPQFPTVSNISSGGPFAVQNQIMAAHYGSNGGALMEIEPASNGTPPADTRAITNFRLLFPLTSQVPYNGGFIPSDYFTSVHQPAYDISAMSNFWGNSVLFTSWNNAATIGRAIEFPCSLIGPDNPRKTHLAVIRLIESGQEHQNKIYSIASFVDPEIDSRTPDPEPDCARFGSPNPIITDFANRDNPNFVQPPTFQPISEEVPVVLVPFAFAMCPSGLEPTTTQDLDLHSHFLVAAADKNDPITNEEMHRHAAYLRHGADARLFQLLKYGEILQRSEFSSFHDPELDDATFSVKEIMGGAIAPYSGSPNTGGITHVAYLSGRLRAVASNSGEQSLSFLIAIPLTLSASEVVTIHPRQILMHDSQLINFNKTILTLDPTSSQLVSIPDIGSVGHAISFGIRATDKCVYMNLRVQATYGSQLQDRMRDGWYRFSIDVAPKPILHEGQVIADPRPSGSLWPVEISTLEPPSYHANAGLQIVPTFATTRDSTNHLDGTNQNTAYRYSDGSGYVSSWAILKKNPYAPFEPNDCSTEELRIPIDTILVALDSPCNDLDFNNDGNIDPLDVDAYFSILGEGLCLGPWKSPQIDNELPTQYCDTLDFNNDGNIDPLDVDAYFSVLGEGPCLR